MSNQSVIYKRVMPSLKISTSEDYFKASLSTHS